MFCSRHGARLWAKHSKINVWTEASSLSHTSILTGTDCLGSTKQQKTKWENGSVNRTPSSRFNFRGAFPPKTKRGTIAKTNETPLSLWCFWSLLYHPELCRGGVLCCVFVPEELGSGLQLHPWHGALHLFLPRRWLLSTKVSPSFPKICCSGLCNVLRRFQRQICERLTVGLHAFLKICSSSIKKILQAKTKRADSLASFLTCFSWCIEIDGMAVH